MPAGLRAAAALARSCHPEPVAAVTAVTAGLAVAVGRGWPGTLLAAAAVLSGQLAIGWHNDEHDRDADRAAGKPGKPVAAGEIGAGTVRTAAVVALVLCLPLSLLSGVPSTLAHALAVGSGLAYNARLKWTLLSGACYALAFGLLPSVVVLGLPGHPWPPAWLTLAGAMLGTGAHFAQVLPDIPRERAEGRGGLPQRMGVLPSAGAASALLLGAVAAAAFGPGDPGPVALAGLVLAGLLAQGVLLAALAGHLGLAFRLTLGVAAVAVGALLLAGR